MAKEANHVVLSGHGGWSVMKTGSLKLSKTFERKEDAIKYGRELSRKEKTELYIHKKNGLVQARYTYGKDPLLAIGL